MNKPIEQLQAEAAAAAEALAAAQAAAAAAEGGAKAEAARQKRIADNEARRNQPIPAAYYTQAKHLEAIAAALLAANGSTPGGTPQVPFVSATVTPPARTVVETDDGPVVEFKAPRLKVTHRGNDIYARVDFNAETTGRTVWRAGHPTGRVRMTVGDSGDAQSFPPKKDGTYSYDAAAAKLMPALRHHEAQYQAAQAKATNAGPLAALRAEFGLPGHSGHSDVIAAERYVRGYGSGRNNGSRTIVAAPGTVLLNLKAQVTPEQARAILAAAVAAGVKL